MHFDFKIVLLTVLFFIEYSSSKQSKYDIDEQSHSPEGCVPYKELPKFLRYNIRRDSIRAPAWCAHLIPTELQTTEAETSSAFEIVTFQHKLSNYVDINVKPLSVAHPLKEVYLTAESIDPESKELGRKVGRFVPADNTHLVCCNYIDRNAILIHADGVTSVNIRWWPDGDYVGPFVFQATIVTQEGKYWTNVLSQIIEAFY